MGVFNSVIIVCPWCGREYEAQSKAGTCELSEKLLQQADPVDQVEVARQGPYICGDCAREVTVVAQVVVSVITREK